MFYCYRITINHPREGILTYVGKHKGRPEDGYMGSCGFIYYKRWLRQHPEWFSKEILGIYESVEECSLNETLFIRRELKEKGSFYYRRDFRGLSCYAKEWLSQFNEGCCLNAHASDSEVACKASRQKVKEHGKTNRAKITSSLNYQRARDKRTEDSFRIGSSKHNYKEIHRKTIRSSISPNNRNVLFNGVVYKGTSNACKAAGNVNWSCQVNRQFKQGIKEVVHHGFHFILLDS